VGKRIGEKILGYVELDAERLVWGRKKGWCRELRFRIEDSITGEGAGG